MKAFVFVLLMFLSTQIVQTQPAWSGEVKTGEAKTPQPPRKNLNGGNP
jgi:hypothetical protein